MTNYNQAQGETLERIKQAVYEVFDINQDILSVRSETTETANKKRLIGWILKTRLLLSNQQISDIFGFVNSNSARVIVETAYDRIEDGTIKVSDIKNKSIELYSKLATFEV